MSDVVYKGIGLRERLRQNGKRVGACYVWTGGKDGDGYGRTEIRDQKHLVHRLAYQIWNGPIPMGVQVQMTCSNRLCFEPMHLILGGPKDHVLRRQAKGRQAKGQHNGRAKMTESEAKVCLKLVRMGVSAPRCGVIFGISKASVLDLRHGINWKHLQ